uniref:Uncharacterized protein n=1 Tax=Chromera velia CCMP2878 TaxID=1169474 RepID=A0A0G4GXI9_9ALVE|eukprot:Cvel_772.t1-p1 / transcript=Cvel_772.t1 / gene=Cvel_772 / organism=Chromera_velia_CCMP2878 / gene_product=hypothetical protein / transcript_product=hypothetical protein / location=Cvel_scaffold24:36729-37748(+) / protein_length=340 / sequence_SO=supercontig / SO=protein_coding / is_pseudo=false
MSADDRPTHLDPDRRNVKKNIAPSEVTASTAAPTLSSAQGYQTETTRPQSLLTPSYPQSYPKSFTAAPPNLQVYPTLAPRPPPTEDHKRETWDAMSKLAKRNTRVQMSVMGTDASVRSAAQHLSNKWTFKKIFEWARERGLAEGFSIQEGGRGAQDLYLVFDGSASSSSREGGEKEPETAGVRARSGPPSLFASSDPSLFEEGARPQRAAPPAPSKEAEPPARSSPPQSPSPPPPPHDRGAHAVLTEAQTEAAAESVWEEIKAIVTRTENNFKGVQRVRMSVLGTYPEVQRAIALSGLGKNKWTIKRIWEFANARGLARGFELRQIGEAAQDLYLVYENQ